MPHLVHEQALSYGHVDSSRHVSQGGGTELCFPWKAPFSAICCHNYVVLLLIMTFNVSVTKNVSVRRTATSRQKVRRARSYTHRSHRNFWSCANGSVNGHIEIRDLCSIRGTAAWQIFTFNAAKHIPHGQPLLHHAVTAVHCPIGSYVRRYHATKSPQIIHATQLHTHPASYSRFRRSRAKSKPEEEIAIWTSLKLQNKLDIYGESPQTCKTTICSYFSRRNSYYPSVDFFR